MAFTITEAISELRDLFEEEKTMKEAKVRFSMSAEEHKKKAASYEKQAEEAESRLGEINECQQAIIQHTVGHAENLQARSSLKSEKQTTVTPMISDASKIGTETRGYKLKLVDSSALPQTASHKRVSARTKDEDGEKSVKRMKIVSSQDST